MRPGLIPGHNVDLIDVSAGLRELAACGYSEPETVMVIDYALVRWSKGEEEAAQRMAIDASFHGINFTSWIRVLAAARAATEPKPEPIPLIDPAKVADQLVRGFATMTPEN